VFSPLMALCCAFCTLWCGLLFGLWSFLFSSLVALPGVFSFFLYLFNKLGHNKWIISGQNGSHQIFFNIRQFSIVFSLLPFPRNKQGAKWQPPNMSKLGNSLLFFTLLISANKQGYSRTPHTAWWPGTPPTRKHTSLGLKSFSYL